MNADGGGECWACLILGRLMTAGKLDVSGWTVAETNASLTTLTLRSIFSFLSLPSPVSFFFFFFLTFLKELSILSSGDDTEKKVTELWLSSNSCTSGSG